MNEKNKNKTQTQTQTQEPPKEQVQGQQTPQEPPKPTRVDLMEERLGKAEEDLTETQTMILELHGMLQQLAEKVNSGSGLEALARILAGAGGNGEKKASAKFGKNTGAKQVKDTKTGITYASLGKCAKAVATEFDVNPDDHFAWYPIYKADPDRFEILG